MIVKLSNKNHVTWLQLWSYRYEKDFPRFSCATILPISYVDVTCQFKQRVGWYHALIGVMCLCIKTTILWLANRCSVSFQQEDPVASFSSSSHRRAVRKTVVINFNCTFPRLRLPLRELRKDADIMRLYCTMINKPVSYQVPYNRYFDLWRLMI